MMIPLTVCISDETTTNCGMTNSVPQSLTLSVKHALAVTDIMAIEEYFVVSIAALQSYIKLR